MTQTWQPPPSAGGPPPPRRLVRRSDEKVVAGVCAALARYTDTDPLLWRISFAVLTPFGGIILALYVLAWLLVPKLGEGPSALERALRQPRANVGTVVAVALGAVLVLTVLDGGPGVGVLLVLGGIAYLVHRDRRDKAPGQAPEAYSPPLVMHGPDPAPTGAPTTTPQAGGVDVTSTLVTPEPYDSGLTAPLGYGAGYGGGYGGSYDTSPFAAWDAGPPPPPVKRRKSQLGVLTLSAAAMLAGALLTLRAAGIEEITVARILAAVLVVLGSGMIVGTWFGRARWLLLPSVLVAAALVPAAVLQAAPGPYGAGVGERTWVPGPTDARTSFELGAGEAQLDLTQLDPADLPTRLSVGLGLGELVVLVPDDLQVVVSAEVRAGEILTRELDGTMRSLRQGGGDMTLDEDFTVGDDDDPMVVLDLSVAAGQIEVRRVAS